MIDIGLEALLIMDKAGIPLLFQNFNPKRTDLEPILLSGFLTAVKEFSLTLIDEGIKDFHVDYGKLLVTILSGQKILFAAIHNQKSTAKISPALSPLLIEFEEKYYDEKEIGESGPLQKYEPFRERIVALMGIANPSFEWIPFYYEKQPLKIAETCKLSNYINNMNSIKDIVIYSECEEKEVLKEISKLWAFGQIKFRNILARQDIPITTNQIVSYLQPHSSEWRALSQEFPNLINTLPYIISHLDGRTTIEKILADFQIEGIENLYWLLDYLYANDAISILTPEKRRILMAKEILHESLELASETYSVKETISNLRKVLNEIAIPEIISQIKLTESSWTIDYSFIVYEGHSPEKVLALYDKWLEILRLFVFSLNEKKRKKYIESLTEKLDYDFFEKYRSEDLDGLEEFAFWLELVFN